MPARRRRSRSRRARTSKRARRLAPPILASILILVVAVVYWREHKPSHPAVKQAAKPLVSKTPEHAPAGIAGGYSRIAERYNAILTNSGGQSAWLKRPARSESGAGSVNGEAIALAPAVPGIVAELKREAAKDGLAVGVQPDTATSAGVTQQLEIKLARAGQDVCTWRIREVPRIYRAAIVIDDMGQDMQRTDAVLRLPYPLTFSVLPHLPASRETSAAAALAGREVMLHLPMEPIGDRMSPGQGAILVGMRAPDVARIVEGDLDSVPNASGVNNHMGSRATSDPALMAAVMKELAAHRLYFIDSRTAASTVALNVARQAGVPAFYRSVFLDDTETVDYTLGQLRAFRSVIERQGAALAIGHPHPTTIAALEKFLPELERDDIKLVPASRLVGLSEVARLSP